MSIENELNQPISEHTLKRDSMEGKRGWGLFALVAGPVITLALLAGACAEPTPKLGNHNVPFIRIEKIEDTNGDGVYDWTDARAQNGVDSVPLLDMNGQREREDGTADPNEPFRITEKDKKLILVRVCTLPVLPKYDVNGSGHVTQVDVDIVEENIGETVPESENPNARLDELRGIIIDGNENNPAKRNHRIEFDTVMGTDPACEKTPNGS